MRETLLRMEAGSFSYVCHQQPLEASPADSLDRLPSYIEQKNMLERPIGAPTRQSPPLYPSWNGLLETSLKSECEPLVRAFVRDDKTIHFCRLFFAEDAEKQPQTLMHEFFHVTDLTRKGPDVYNHNPQFYDIALLPGGSGIRNPDSLVAFVEIASGTIDLGVLLKRRDEHSLTQVSGFDKGQEPVVRAVVNLARAWIEGGQRALSGDVSPVIQRALKDRGLDAKSTFRMLNHALQYTGRMALAVPLDSRVKEDGPTHLRLPKDEFPATGQRVIEREKLEQLVRLTIPRFLSFTMREQARQETGGAPPDRGKSDQELQSLAFVLQLIFSTEENAKYLLEPEPAATDGSR